MEKSSSSVPNAYLVHVTTEVSRNNFNVIHVEGNINLENPISKIFKDDGISQMT